MSISDLIEDQVDLIVDEWIAFARSRIPESAGLSDHELADHAKVLLQASAADVRRVQSAGQKHGKSVGLVHDAATDITRIGGDHARQRFAQGFTLEHLVAEFRALRASVIRRWTEQLSTPTVASVDQLTRFGETIDEALAASVSLYSKKVDDSRNLLLGVLGHDLRNPLGVVAMTSDYLLQRGTLDEVEAGEVARMQRSANRMTRMVSDLLDFTQTALGIPLPIAPQTADLRELAASIVGEVRTLHPHSKLDLSTEGDLTGAWDPERIGQMLSNLIANAVQHGERGKPVSIHLAAAEKAVVVRIRNEGPTLSPDVQRTLFQPLRQTDPGDANRHVGSSGLGLGLYITREIAVAHGGSVEVASAQHTTTFCVTLPRTTSSRSQPSQG